MNLYLKIIMDKYNIIDNILKNNIKRLKRIVHIHLNNLIRETNVNLFDFDYNKSLFIEYNLNNNEDNLIIYDFYNDIRNTPNLYKLSDLNKYMYVTLCIKTQYITINNVFDIDYFKILIKEAESIIFLKFVLKLRKNIYNQFVDDIIRNIYSNFYIPYIEESPIERFYFKFFF